MIRKTIALDLLIHNDDGKCYDSETGEEIDPIDYIIDYFNDKPSDYVNFTLERNDNITKPMERLHEDIEKAKQNEPERKYEDFMKTLVCDCCDDTIIDKHYPVAVINPYECLCLHCWRGEGSVNAKNIKTNADNYSLRSSLDSIKHDAVYERMIYNNQLVHYKKEMDKQRELLDEQEEQKENINKIVQSTYKCALGTDSAAAIEVARNLKEKWNEIR